MERQGKRFVTRDQDQGPGTRPRKKKGDRRQKRQAISDNNNQEESMESVQLVRHIFQTVETLPSTFVDDLHEAMEEQVEELLKSLQYFIKTSLSDNEICGEDFSKDQFQDLLNCMVLFNGEHPNSNEGSSDQYHPPIRRVLREEDEAGLCALEYLCRDEPKGSLSTLKHLRELKLFHKKDIAEMELLRHSIHESHSMFLYLVDWDPTALKSLSWAEDLTLLQESIEWHFPTKLIKLFISTGLKYLPNELGLLLFKGEEGESPYALLMDKNRETNGEEAGWTIIEQCLEEVADLKLYEPLPTTNLYPFMVAACDQSCPCVDLVYYLLRKDPSVMLQFNRSHNDERGLEEGTSRKRKMMQ
jgi:hypothetical protein